MSRRKKALKVAAGVLGVVVLTAIGIAVVGVRASDHPTEPAKLGESRSFSQMNALIDVPGPIAVETITGADWAVPLSGLINLDHPDAKAASLKDRIEPIQIYLHVLRHPARGRFLVDTGVEKALRDDPANAAIRGVVASVAHLERLVVRRDTASVVKAEGGTLAGVLLTHLHFDHISGMPDVPRGTEVFSGPGEASQRFGLNLFAKGTTDRLLEGHRPLAEWQFSSDPGWALRWHPRRLR